MVEVGTLFTFGEQNSRKPRKVPLRERKLLIKKKLILGNYTWKRLQKQEKSKI